MGWGVFLCSVFILDLQPSLQRVERQRGSGHVDAKSEENWLHLNLGLLPEVKALSRFATQFYSCEGYLKYKKDISKM